MAPAITHNSGIKLEAELKLAGDFFNFTSAGNLLLACSLMLALRCVLLIVMKIATRTPEPYCRMFEGKKEETKRRIKSH
jgi:hypothetical protein